MRLEVGSWKRIGLWAGLGLGVVAVWVLPLVALEQVFQGGQWLGCSSAFVELTLSSSSRALTVVLGFAGWVAGLAMLLRRAQRPMGIALILGSVWLVGTNYRVMVYNMCTGEQVRDLFRAMTGQEPIADFRADPGGPIDPTQAGLPVSVPLGEPACWYASGKALTVYRIWADPSVFSAPFLRWWPTQAKGVGNVFGTRRTMWVCGQGTPRAVFQQLARQAGHDPEGVRIRSESDGTTRGEVLH